MVDGLLLVWKVIRSIPSGGSIELSFVPKAVVG